jgi:hypothetical protein
VPVQTLLLLGGALLVLVPDNRRAEDAALELLQLIRLVLGTLRVGLGNVKVALRVGETA